MINESYYYVALYEKTLFIFESEGVNGKILKGIIYEPVGKNQWNLGFGDIINGEIDDSIVSNNHDILKVMQTIAKTIYEFLGEFPERTIVIKPVDERRRKLYNRIFQRHFEDMKPIFDISGFIEQVEEVYSPKKYYDYFKISRKFEL